MHTKNEKLFQCKRAKDVKKCIEDGVHVDALRADGATPLIVHSAAGNNEVVQELIKQRANVDTQDKDGLSALMVASRNGHSQIVKALCDCGAQLKLKNKEVYTLRYSMKIEELSYTCPTQYYTIRYRSQCNM